MLSAAIKDTKLNRIVKIDDILAMIGYVTEVDPKEKEVKCEIARCC